MSRASTPSAAGRGRPVEPIIMSRKDLRKQASGRRRTWWFVLAGVIVVGAGVAAAILLTRNSASSTSAQFRADLPSDRGGGSGRRGARPTGAGGQGRQLLG